VLENRGAILSEEPVWYGFFVFVWVCFCLDLFCQRLLVLVGNTCQKGRLEVGEPMLFFQLAIVYHSGNIFFRVINYCSLKKQYWLIIDKPSPPNFPFGLIFPTKIFATSSTGAVVVCLLITA